MRCRSGLHEQPQTPVRFSGAVAGQKDRDSSPKAPAAAGTAQSPRRPRWPPGGEGRRACAPPGPPGGPRGRAGFSPLKHGLDVERGGGGVVSRGSRRFGDHAVLRRHRQVNGRPPSIQVSMRGWRRGRRPLRLRCRAAASQSRALALDPARHELAELGVGVARQPQRGRAVAGSTNLPPNGPSCARRRHGARPAGALQRRAQGGGGDEDPARAAPSGRGRRQPPQTGDPGRAAPRRCRCAGVLQRADAAGPARPAGASSMARSGVRLGGRRAPFVAESAPPAATTGSGTQRACTAPGQVISSASLALHAHGQSEGAHLEVGDPAVESTAPISDSACSTVSEAPAAPRSISRCGVRCSWLVSKPAV